MAGEIKVNYGVMEQIIGDIEMLAAQMETYAKGSDALSTSRGVTADNMRGAVTDVATFARVLAQVMHYTANQLVEAKETMMATDEGLTVQFDGSGGSGFGSGGGSDKGNKRGPEAGASKSVPKDVRLGDLASGRSGGSGW